MSIHTEELSVELLEQVLSRLGLADRPTPTLDGLQRLYAAWCRKVPFDNVRKLIHLHSHSPGPLPGDDPAEFLTAWLAYGTGVPAGPAMGLYMLCSCRWVLMPRVAWGPCARTLRRHRRTARCWSPVKRPVMSSMPRSYTAPRCHSTSPCPQAWHIRHGASTAASVTTPGTSGGVLSISLTGWIVACSTCT